MALATERQQDDAAAAGDGANSKQRFIAIDVLEDENDQQAYSVYWGACFATGITWVFAVTAASDDSWVNFNGRDGLQVGDDCGFNDSVCSRYTAASAFQAMATIIVSLAVLLVVIAAFSSPPATGQLGLALGVMLAVFSLFQMLAFSLMAFAVAEFEEANIEAGPTLGVAVMAWLFGLAGTFTILFLRLRVTSEQEGPFRKFLPRRSGTTGRALPERNNNIGTV